MTKQKPKMPANSTIQKSLIHLLKGCQKIMDNDDVLNQRKHAAVITSLRLTGLIEW